MNLQEFRKKIDNYTDEICNADGFVSSHNLQSTIKIEDENSEYELADIDISRLLGCGCWSGIILRIKKIEEND